MPTYVYLCDAGHSWSQWQSIKDDALTVHPICQRPCRRVIQSAPFHRSTGAGARVDAVERGWDKDMDAYKRLRHDGYQPMKIDGCDELEATATDPWCINTNGKVRVPDDRAQEVRELVGLAQATDWSPIQQVHENRAASEG